MRRGFTLIEILTVVAVIGIMLTAAMVNFSSGTAAARIKGATRDIFGTIRQARSVALVTQQPAIITYSEKEIDGEVCAKVLITTAKMVGKGVTRAETLAGETIFIGDGGEADGSGEGADGSGGGETLEDILFAPMSEEVVRGVRIRVTVGDERLSFDDRDENRNKAKISVFSNVDYLLGRYDEAKKAEEAAKAEETATPAVAAPAASSELQDEVSVVWEVNGRCEPHRVWIYRDGSSPDKGLCIKVDRFGAAKVLAGDE